MCPPDDSDILALAADDDSDILALAEMGEEDGAPPPPPRVRTDAEIHRDLYERSAARGAPGRIDAFAPSDPTADMRVYSTPDHAQAVAAKEAEEAHRRGIAEKVWRIYQEDRGETPPEMTHEQALEIVRRDEEVFENIQGEMDLIRYAGAIPRGATGYRLGTGGRAEGTVAEKSLHDARGASAGIPPRYLEMARERASVPGRLIEGSLEMLAGIAAMRAALPRATPAPLAFGALEASHARSLEEAKERFVHGVVFGTLAGANTRLLGGGRLAAGVGGAMGMVEAAAVTGEPTPSLGETGEAALLFAAFHQPGSKKRADIVRAEQQRVAEEMARAAPAPDAAVAPSPSAREAVERPAAEAPAQRPASEPPTTIGDVPEGVHLVREGDRVKVIFPDGRRVMVDGATPAEAYAKAREVAARGGDAPTPAEAPRAEPAKPVETEPPPTETPRTGAEVAAPETTPAPGPSGVGINRRARRVLSALGTQREKELRASDIEHTIADQEARAAIQEKEGRPERAADFRASRRHLEAALQEARAREAGTPLREQIDEAVASLPDSATYYDHRAKAWARAATPEEAARLEEASKAEPPPPTEPPPAAKSRQAKAQKRRRKTDEEMAESLIGSQVESQRGDVVDIADYRIDKNGLVVLEGTGADGKPAEIPLSSLDAAQIRGARTRGRAPTEGPEAGAVDIGLVVEGIETAGRKVAAGVRRLFGERLEGVRQTGPVGERIESEAREVIADAQPIRDRIFRMAEPTLRALSQLRNQRRVNRLAEPRPVAGTDRATSGMRDWVEGWDKDIPAEVAPDVEGIRRTYRQRGGEAEMAGARRFNTETGLDEPFKQYVGPNGETVVPHYPSRTLDEIIRKGTKHRLWEQAIRQHAEANPEMKPEAVRRIFEQLHEEAIGPRGMDGGERREAFEFFRQFKRVPDFIRERAGRPWEQLYETDPVKILQRGYGAAERIAFGQRMGWPVPDTTLQQNLRDAIKSGNQMAIDEAQAAIAASTKEPRRVAELRKEWAEETSGEGDFDAILRGLHGRSPAAQPRSRAWSRALEITQKVMQIPKALMMSRSPAVSLLETTGPVAEFGGTHSLPGSLARLTRDAAAARRGEATPERDWLRQYGALSTTEIPRFSVDPNAKASTIVDLISNWINRADGVEFVNRTLNQDLAAYQLKGWLDGLRADPKARPDVAAKIVERGGFSKEVAERLASGKATDAEMGEFVRRMTARFTSGNLAPLERSAAETNRGVQALTGFLRYPLAATRDSARAATAFAREMTRAANPASGLTFGQRGAVAGKALARFGEYLARRGVQGALAQGVLSAIMPGSQGLSSYLEKWADDPWGETWKAVLTSSLAGSLGQLARGVIEESPGETLERAVLPYQLLKDSWNTVTGTGRMAEFEPGARWGMLFRRYFPALQVIDSAAGWTVGKDTKGRTQYAQDVDLAYRRFYEWKDSLLPRSAPWARPAASTDESLAYRRAMRTAQTEIRKMAPGDAPSEALRQALVAAVRAKQGDTSKVAKGLRGMRPFQHISDQQQFQFKQRHERLWVVMAHQDALMDALARSVDPPSED